MQPSPGSFRIARIFGVDVLLHWSWVLIALLEVQNRKGVYSSQVYNVAEYLCLFLIVLLHEFGHALACRSVGGRADRIILWPLGGIAYVDPPRRPGAVLWSIAAGPLVNLALVPVLFTLSMVVNGRGDDLEQFVSAVSITNGVLFVFNVLPIYPLDGGKIVQSLLWFFIGEVRALKVATVIGLIGAGGLLLGALYFGDWWLGLIALYSASRSFSALQSARAASQTPPDVPPPDVAPPPAAGNPPS